MKARKGGDPGRKARPRSTAACARSDALWPYLDGELAPARAAAVVRHVATCQACARRVARLRAMLEACRSAGCRKLPSDVRARARARARRLARGN